MRDSSPPRPADEVAQLQAEKLRLEIAALKAGAAVAEETARLQAEKLRLESAALGSKRRRWPDVFVQMLPFLTTLCTVGGLLLGIWSFRVGQSKQQELEIRTQIRQDLTELHQLAHTDARPGKIRFLIEDLKELTKDRPADFRLTMDLMLEIARYDLDYTKPQNVSVGNMFTKHWPAYLDVLRARPDDNEPIVVNYLNALKSVPETPQNRLHRKWLVLGMERAWEPLRDNPNLTDEQKLKIDKWRANAERYLSKDQQVKKTEEKK
jgi:hypothetical protein